MPRASRFGEALRDKAFTFYYEFILLLLKLLNDSRFVNHGKRVRSISSLVAEVEKLNVVSGLEARKRWRIVV